MMKTLISSENIVKSYGNENSANDGAEKRNVLDGVSVSVSEGEFVTIMGPSGCGKSTLLFAMSGMDTIDSGAVFFENKDLTLFKEQELADLRRTKMGFVFQQPTLLKNLNILDNIILPVMSGNKKSSAKTVENAKMLMQKIGISELEKRDITQASGGQLQRAGICRALMSEPKIIFGDEPTGALNSKSADEVMDILVKINAEGTAILLVTHDAKIAAHSQRILFMCDGKIVNEMNLAKLDGKDIDGRTKKIITNMQEIGI